jgi:hypothetical protein
MEAAVRARDAGRQAVRDVSPDPLRERIDSLLDESAMVPGVLALASAHAVEGATTTGVTPEASDDDGKGRANGPAPASSTTEPAGTDAGPVGVEERAAGVQLIYEGLRLTRALADDPPWERDSPHTDSNIDILAADVMVARGFSLLARTEAADKAVETVQSFGRDETDDQQGRPVPTHALETDVFELAVVAGTTAFGAAPSDALLAYAAELAESLDGDRPEPPESIAEAVEQAVVDAPNPRQFGPAEDPRPSATDP